MPTSVLHSYRHAYRLPIPSCYTHPAAPIMLSQGIGRRSPTAIASRRLRKQLSRAQSQNQTGHKTTSGENGGGGGKTEREQVAIAVRKHFNDAAINEASTIVRLVYIGKEGSKGFRSRFHPDIK